MSQGDILNIMQEAMLVCFKMAGPMLIISIIVGLLVAIFQAATQIHEQTLTFVPKVLVISLVLLFTGSYMMTTITEFFNKIFDKISGM